MEKRRQWITLRRMGRGVVIFFLVLGVVFLLSCIWSAAEGLEPPADWPQEGNATAYRIGRILGLAAGFLVGGALVLWSAKELRRRSLAGNWASEPLPQMSDPSRLWPKLFWGGVIVLRAVSAVLQLI